MQTRFLQGLKDGIGIALGYISVSFTFGIAAVSSGVPVWAAVLISMTNVTSAGQFAGLPLIVASAPYIEMILTQLVINIRYSLMSLSLTQKLDSSFTLIDRLLISFMNTDEIFAVASSAADTGRGSSSYGKYVSRSYMYGLILLPFLGWVFGTFLGAAAGSLLPNFLQSAFGIMIYGMFIAIIIPPSKKMKTIRMVVIVSAILSCIFTFVPILNNISSGFSIIICTLISAAIAAVLFPIEQNDTQLKQNEEEKTI